MINNSNNNVPTKTSSFLLPALGLDLNLLYSFGFLNSYISDSKMSYGDDKKLIYLLFKCPENPESLQEFEEFCSLLREQDNYIDEYDPEEGKVMVVMKVLDKWSKVYDQFIIGKYSNFPKEYVHQFFRPKVYVGLSELYKEPVWKDSVNWKILHRCDTLKHDLEKRLDVSLPQGAEVFSRPNELECYR